MRVVIVTLLLALGAGAAFADSPISLVSKVESGWTSNATESAGGRGDFYLRHSHDFSVLGEMGPLALRTGFMLEQHVFRQHEGENDLSVTGGVEAGLTLSESMALRMGYALTREWTGKVVDLGPLSLSIKSPETSYETLGEIRVAGDGRLVVMGFDMRASLPGLSEFEGLAIPPVQIEPEVAEVTARLDGEWVVTPDLAGLARLHWINVSVPDDDRFGFSREPASVARLATGIRLRQAAWSLEARGGLDLVWPKAAPHLALWLPYAEANASMSVTEQFSLTARALAGVETFKPVDGVAGRLLEAELGGRFALTEALALSGGLAVTQERGLYEERLAVLRRSIRGGVAVSLARGGEVEFAVNHMVVEETGGAYPVTRIGLTLAGRV